MQNGEQNVFKTERLKEPRERDVFVLLPYCVTRDLSDWPRPSPPRGRGYNDVMSE